MCALTWSQEIVSPSIPDLPSTGEASLASDLLRLPHKINHFCCTKSGRPLYWEHNWHQISIFQKLSNQQSISQENRHYVTSSPSAISQSLNIKSWT